MGCRADAYRSPLLGSLGRITPHSQVPALPNGVIRVNADGTLDLIANLSAFVMASFAMRRISSRTFVDRRQGPFGKDNSTFTDVPVKSCFAKRDSACARSSFSSGS